jgi:F-type H+-transporting ATPase subunit a
MTVAFVIVVGFLTLVTNGAKVVPGRMQAVGETLFGMIDGLTESIIGHDGKKLLPVRLHDLHLHPGDEPAGPVPELHRHLADSRSPRPSASSPSLLVVIIGFVKNGAGFFKLFWPSGAPLVMRPVVGLIEFFSFLLRPITLTLRLFGNMMGGHVALKVFAGFVATAVIGGASAGSASRSSRFRWA